MDIEKHKFFSSFRIPIILIILMISAFLYSTFFKDLYFLGIYPHRASGLIGIITTIFIHGDFSHLIGNIIPLLILGTALFYYYKDFALLSLILMWLSTGLWVWIIARENYHIGASGLVYALAAFHIISAFVRKDFRLMAFAMLVVFLYGSLIWGIFPEFFPEKNISWESHLMGGIAGFLYGFYFRKHKTNLIKKKVYFENDDLGSEYIWPDEFYEEE